MNDTEIIAVDEFLRYNPCFLPLKDPEIVFGSGSPFVKRQMLANDIIIGMYVQEYSCVMFRLRHLYE